MNPRDRSPDVAAIAAAVACLVVSCNFQPSPNVAGGDSSTGPPEVAPSATILGTTTTPLTAEQAATPSRISTPTTSPSASFGSPATVVAAPCSDRAFFVDDVTIRDNTLVMPGDPLVKIWRLRNDGTCTWDATYAAVFIGGDRLDAASLVHLTTSVPPGSAIDLAIDMTAPDQAGTYQGFWKLIGKNEKYFGIGANGEVSFWVKIVVPLLPTPTGVLAPTFTPTASVTPRATPEPVSAGSISLTVDMRLDLDTGEIDRPSGSDVSLLEPTPGAISLVPTGGALLSRYGPPPDPPSPSQCQALELNNTAIPLSSLSIEGLVCYRTEEGRLGYFRVESLDGHLGIAYLTWEP